MFPTFLCFKQEILWNKNFKKYFETKLFLHFCYGKYVLAGGLKDKFVFFKYKVLIDGGSRESKYGEGGELKREEMNWYILFAYFFTQYVVGHLGQVALFFKNSYILYQTGVCVKEWNCPIGTIALRCSALWRRPEVEADIPKHNLQGTQMGKVISTF